MSFEPVKELLQGEEASGHSPAAMHVKPTEVGRCECNLIHLSVSNNDPTADPHSRRARRGGNGSTGRPAA